MHHVGNKFREEDLKISKALFPIQDNGIKDLLLKYFLSPFKNPEYHHLHHESDLKFNEIYAFAGSVFDNPDSFFLRSVEIAKHLYEKSMHPKIKGGELYVAYLSDCMVDGEAVEALGIFKSESKETYLKVYPSADNFEIEHEDGININKLDKGCLVFNAERDKGYKVCIIDNLSKSGEAQYWKDDFLQLRPREDAYYHTKNYLGMCNSFIHEKLKEDFDVSKADEAALMHRSVDYFKKKDIFDINEFTNEVMLQPEITDAFKAYKKEYQEKRATPVFDEFDISATAVKKSAQIYKSIIRLDKSFHIYIHGGKDNIVKGFDASSGMNFYQLFFKQEH